ncbi:MAG: HlyD family efflux transporter periplasmic adaptor subunit [Acidobacteria bacterium]|nr:HlyD family efflux transporter periplasmic adaptor subunit [Acidobacteriota bacterium]
MKRTLLFLFILSWAAGPSPGAEVSALKEGPYAGTVEMKETRLAPMETERLVARRAAEGMRVHAGDDVARLDTSLLEAEARRLEAEVGSRGAKVREMAAGSRTEDVREARARKESADTALALARMERARAEKLLAAGAGSQAAVDRARASEETSVHDAERASAALSLLEAGERREQRDAARGELDAATRALEIVRQRIDRMTLRAPADAVVLDTYYEVGEVVPAGRPIVKLGDASSPYVDIYVAPEDLSALRIGSKLPAKVDGFGDRAFQGTVTEMGAEAEFTPRAILTPRERARLVFRVRVTIDPAGTELHPGVTAEVAGP